VPAIIITKREVPMGKISRILLITLVVLSLSFMGIGCARAAEVVSDAVTEAVDEVAPPAEKLVFGNIPVALSDEWNGYSVENFLFAANKKGVEVVVLDPQWDGEKALANLEDLITRGVDHISVFVYTPEQAQDFILRANDANIPISFENTKLVDQVTGDYVVGVAVEYYEVGYQALKFISETYPGSKVFYARGLPGMGIIEEYERGIAQALEDTGNVVEITVRRDTQWNTETAQDATMDVIAAGEEFDVIFANNESMAVGVYNALQDAGMAGEIPIIATGGGPTGVQMLKDGIIQTTIAAPVSLQGLYLFKAMYLYSTQGIEPPEKFIDYPAFPISLDNLDENIPWEPSDALIERIGGLDSW
jgi:ABC-type sugar transport system substrate-binding protein